MFRRIGVDGLDLTVRPGGHIEPEDAKTALPKAAQAARDVGLEIMMLTTGITTTDRHAEEILATCNKLGIDRIKLGYYGSGRFGRFGKLGREMSDVRRRLDGAVKLAAKYGVRPRVHVHSGETIPSNGFLLHQMIRDIPPDRIGAFLDSYHMRMTGAAGGWRQAHRPPDAVDLARSPEELSMGANTHYCTRRQRDFRNKRALMFVRFPSTLSRGRANMLRLVPGGNGE